MSVLCVIDMQPEFVATYTALPGVLCEIRKAMSNNEHIIIVEYQGAGLTHESILALIADYNKVLFVTKLWNDGAEEIIKEAKKHKISLRNMKVVGVNLSFCVYETVVGLSRRFRPPKIEVILSATYCSGGWEYAVDRFKKEATQFKNVRIA